MESGAERRNFRSIFLWTSSFTSIEISCGKGNATSHQQGLNLISKGVDVTVCGFLMNRWNAISRKNGLHLLLTADVYRVISALVKYPGNGVSHCHRCMVFIMKKSSNLCASHSPRLREKLFCFNFNLSSVKVSSLYISGLMLHFKFIHSLTPCNFLASKSNSARAN